MFTWSPVTTMCVSSPSHSRFPFSSIFYRTRSRSRRLVHEISFNNDSKSHRLLPYVDRRPKGNGFTSYLGRRRRQPLLVPFPSPHATSGLPGLEPWQLENLVMPRCTPDPLEKRLSSLIAVT